MISSNTIFEAVDAAGAELRREGERFRLIGQNIPPELARMAKENKLVLLAALPDGCRWTRGQWVADLRAVAFASARRCRFPAMNVEDPVSGAMVPIEGTEHAWRDFTKCASECLAGSAALALDDVLAEVGA